MASLLEDDALTNARPYLVFAAKACVLIAGCLILGTACHELVGHGLTAVAFGATITDVQILGVRVWPSLDFLGWDGRYGACWWQGDLTESQSNWALLCGAGSTWLLALLATILLWCHRWGVWGRWILTGFSIWWLDVLTYTAPSWGLKRSILWGGSTSEPYNAAIGLGCPAWAYQSIVILSSLAMAVATAIRLRQLRRKP